MLPRYPQVTFLNIDALNYASRFTDHENLSFYENYQLVHLDICDPKINHKINGAEILINFAAESHVDNSIKDPNRFVHSNILGVQNLLNACRQSGVDLFVQISTDEVYGSLLDNAPPSKENDQFFPSSPYSASKAAAELLCFAAEKTFGQKIIITRSCNNYGPYQYPEKFIPVCVQAIMEGKCIPVYGVGKNKREWIYVEDNCTAIEHILCYGQAGQAYNIGSGDSHKNIELAKLIISCVGYGEISFVADRPGHDLRYNLNCEKINALGWQPKWSFYKGIQKTVEWYVQRYKNTGRR